MSMKLLLTLLLTSQVLSQSKTTIPLSQFQKSNRMVDLSRFEGTDLVLETREVGGSGWFFYPKAVKPANFEKVEIEVTVKLASKDACIEIGSTLDPAAKNGLLNSSSLLRFYNTVGDPGGSLFYHLRKNGVLTGEFISPAVSGAHSLKMTVTKDSCTLYLLPSHGIWQRLKSLPNPLPDSFYVAVTASERGKWILAAGQIVLTSKPIAPSKPSLLYGKTITMCWNKNAEPKVKYRAHLGLASRSYHMSWLTPDTFFIFTNLDTGRVYFGAVTAIDSAGNESTYSDEVTFIRRDTTKADPLDLDGNRKVTRADYTLLKSNFGKAGKGDFDTSGEVDELDLLWYWRFGSFNVE